MNVERMTEALKIIEEECAHTECVDCPLKHACMYGLDEVIGEYAGYMLRY